MDTPVCRYPETGTSIGGGRFQLVSTLGTGGYGKVYKAQDTISASHPYYAVKCLPRCSDHQREIELHHLVSDHPGVVTLFGELDENDFIYLIMEYAPDRDLFAQILEERRYLGNDVLIRSTFLQILDAVEYCHSVGVYHRDLKPENFMCFDGGCRVGLADFGLATTGKFSTEFQTGSIYHMSPECFAAEMTCEGVYSPQSCDIWSLGIILIDIVTGRNPWNFAKREDAAFRSYVQNPSQHLPTTLPISAELNEVLVMMLSMEWKARPAISEIRDAVKRIPSFYSKDVVFDENVAKCLWEVDRDNRSVVHRRVDLLEERSPPPSPPRPQKQPPGKSLRSRIFKEKIPLFGEGDSDSDTSTASSSSTTTLDSVDDLSPWALDKRLKERQTSSSFILMLSGIQRWIKYCPIWGRTKVRVIRDVV